jgi:small subunit ribosomal protein S21
LNAAAAHWSVTLAKKVDVVQIKVMDNNVEKAMKVLKRMLAKEGVFRQLKEKRFAEKPSDARRRKQRQARRRLRRQASRAAARSRG